MKIAYLMQAGVPDIRKNPLTGPANHVKNTFIEFLKSGNQVCLVAYFDKKIWKSYDLITFEEVLIPWLGEGPVRIFERIIRRIQFELKLPYLALFESYRFAVACRQVLIGYDLFYERMGWMGYGGTIASRNLRIPLILEVNGDHLDELKMLGMEPHGLQRWLSVYIMKKLARSADYTVTTGEGWRQKHILRWGIDPSRISVIENGSEIVNLLKRDQLRCFSRVKNTGPVTLIYIGGFEPWHGLELLIHAIDKVISRGHRVQLYLVGSGTISQDIEQLIKSLELEAYITITGSLPIDKVAELLCKSDIGVSPYFGRVEFSGLKLLDYKGAGLATIASGENGQPALIQNGRTGLIVPPGDEEKLVNAITHLCSDVEFRIRMGQAARIEAENLHTWDRSAFELQKIFQQVVANEN